jgi:outer membrane protein assembly factor BamB
MGFATYRSPLLRGHRSVVVAAVIAASASLFSGFGPTADASANVNWPEWGFNAQHTGYNPSETVLTRANAGKLVQVFATAVRALPDPIVANGVVYLSDNASGTVEAINAVTGTVEWSRGSCHTGEETSDPAFAAGAVWVGLNDPGLAAVSDSGTNVKCIGAGDLFLSPPTVQGGTVYAGGQSGVAVAIDAATGKLRWTHTLKGYQSLSSPAVSRDGSAVYVSAGAYVDKLDGATGALLWSRYIDTCGESAVAISGARLFVGGCNLYALSSDSGRVLWSSTRLGPNVMAPAVDGDSIIAGAPLSSNFDAVAAFDARTGKRLWTSTAVPAASPTVANGVVYVNEDNFEILMLNSSTGAKIGSVSPGPTSLTGSVLPVDGRVYFEAVNANGDGGELYAYGPRSSRSAG